MKLDRIKPISFFKANAAEILADLESGEPMIITQNGEAKAVVQDIVSYERTQETLAMLKLVAFGKREMREGRMKPARTVIEHLRVKNADRE